MIRLISFCWGQIALDIFIIEGLPNCSADWMFNIKLLNVCQRGSFASTYDGDDNAPVCVWGAFVRWVKSTEIRIERVNTQTKPHMLT